MDTYEKRLAKFIKNNREKLDKLKSIESKMKKINKIREQLKDDIESSLSEYNLQGYSEDGVTISRKKGHLRWDFKKELTNEQKDEIRNDLCDTTDYFEYREVADSWSWRFS